MSYTNELIRHAKKLGQSLSVERSDDTNKYLVRIDMVGYKDGYLRQSIFGIGFTIEDACYDFIRKCKGGYLAHYITEDELRIP